MGKETYPSWKKTKTISVRVPIIAYDLCKKAINDAVDALKRKQPELFNKKTEQPTEKATV